VTIWLIAFMVAFLLPILNGSWRLGLIGLGLQTTFLAVIITSSSHELSLPLGLQLVDLVFVRGVLVPAILISVLRRVGISRDHDLLPTNFIYWAGLFILIGMGTWFGYLLYPEDYGRALQCGTAAAGLLSALFVLSLQAAGVGQIFAILLMENSIILFEFLNPHLHSLALQLAISVVFIFLILVFRTFLLQLSTLTSNEGTGEDKDLI